jgi:hypothetical protein
MKDLEIMPDSPAEPLNRWMEDSSLSTREADELPFQPIFVVGAPRSGTHFIHALACTSEQANLFTPEYHYFYYLLEAYLGSLNAFNAAESAGFASLEEFSAHHFAYMRSVLLLMWERLGKPKSLVMKHCSLTPFLPVLARRFPSMKFLAIQRDARDSVASEVRAVRKKLGDPLALPQNAIEQAVKRYNLYYGSLISAATELQGRLHCVRYEDLVLEKGIREISQFLGFDDIDPKKLWQRATFDIGDFGDFLLHSDLWGAPMTSKHVGRYRDTLPSETAEQIRAETKRVSLAFEALCGP